VVQLGQYIILFYPSLSFLFPVFPVVFLAGMYLLAHPANIELCAFEIQEQ
jgi:hypothetical protein